jgi:hypothetical protein
MYYMIILRAVHKLPDLKRRGACFGITQGHKGATHKGGRGAQKNSEIEIYVLVC